MRRALLAALGATTALAACGSGLQSSNQRIDRTVEDVDRTMDRFATGGIRSGGVQFSDHAFVAAQRERNNAAARLPREVQGSNAVILQSRDQMGIADIATRLTEITRIPHSLALGPTGRPTSDATFPDGNGANTSPTAQQARSSDDITTIRVRPNLRGPLSEVLNEVAASFGVEWSYDDGRVIFRDFVTREYSISALPLTSSTSSAISANDVSTSTEASLDVWTEISEAIEQMLSEGSTVSFGQSTGTVSITARTGDHARVAEYIRNLNQRVGQQVSFDVNVITVVLNEGENFGIDLSAALARGGVSVSAAGNAQIDESVGSINIGVIRNSASVQAVARSLAQYGRVSVETRAGTTTANNRPAPIEVIDSIAYLSEVRIEENTTTGSERITRTAETAEIGFQMQLLPRIMNTRDIMVHYAVRISELNNLRTFGDGNEAIQLPEISTTSFEQQAVVENGQTLIMAGFERRRVESEERRGIGLMAVSRGAQSSTQRVATVIMITPTIVRR